MTYKKCVLCDERISTAGKNIPKDDTKYLCLSCWKKIDGSEIDINRQYIKAMEKQNE